MGFKSYIADLGFGGKPEVEFTKEENEQFELAAEKHAQSMSSSFPPKGFKFPDIVARVFNKPRKERVDRKLSISHVKRMKKSDFEKKFKNCFESIESKMSLFAPFKDYQIWPGMWASDWQEDNQDLIQEAIELHIGNEVLRQSLVTCTTDIGVLGPNFHLTSKKGMYKDMMLDPIFGKDIMPFLVNKFVGGFKSITPKQAEEMVVKGSYTSGLGYTGDPETDCSYETKAKMDELEKNTANHEFIEWDKKGYFINGARTQPGKVGKVRYAYTHEGLSDVVVWTEVVHPFGVLGHRGRLVTNMGPQPSMVTANQYVELAKGSDPTLKLIFEQETKFVSDSCAGFYLYATDVPNNDAHMWPSVIDYTLSGLLSKNLWTKFGNALRTWPIVGAYWEADEDDPDKAYPVWYEAERVVEAGEGWDKFYQNFSGHGLTKWPNAFQNLALQLWCHRKVGVYSTTQAVWDAIGAGEILVLNNGDDCLDGAKDPAYMEKFKEISENNPYAPRGEEELSYGGKNIIHGAKGLFKSFSFPIPSLFKNTFFVERRNPSSKVRSLFWTGIAARINMAFDLDSTHSTLLTKAVDLLYRMIKVRGMDEVMLKAKVEMDEWLAQGDERQAGIEEMVQLVRDAGYHIKGAHELLWNVPNSVMYELDPVLFDLLFIQYPKTYTKEIDKFVNTTEFKKHTHVAA